MGIVEEGYTKAVEVLEKCSTRHGLFASGGRGGYNSVWSRDSMIALLGAALVPEKKFKKVLERTLDTLSKNQSPRGQIPNAVDLFDKKRLKQVTFATLDSSLWYVVGEHCFSKAFLTKSNLKKHKKNLDSAMQWLRYQDAGEDFLPEQQPTCDWQDCFPHKYGHVLNTQALYYSALKFQGEKALARKVSTLVNGKGRKDLNMFDKKLGYYLPWIWKDHDGIREQENWFDSLGNVLAILSGLASPKQTKAILNFIELNSINSPFPVRAIFPPIKKKDPEWKEYFSKCLAGSPHKYINGGIWPYIGGLYVAALVKAKKFSRAEAELASLANANKLGLNAKWEFNEWINPLNGKASGSSYHAWSAGSYIFAYHCVSEKKVPFF